MKRIALIISVLSISGCTTITPEKMAAKSDADVCRTAGAFRNLMGNNKLAKPYQDELEKRKLLSEKELVAVKNGEIFIGMSECGLYASWGFPVRQNRSVNTNGIKVQNVYGGSYSKSSYVYTSNGVITSWQD